MVIRLDPEADEDALGVGQVTDDLAEGRGQSADERRDGEDVVAPASDGLLDQIDDLDLVAPGQMLLAQVLQVGERAQRLGRLTRDVQAQVPPDPSRWPSVDGARSVTDCRPLS